MAPGVQAGAGGAEAVLTATQPAGAQPPHLTSTCIPASNLLQFIHARQPVVPAAAERAGAGQPHHRSAHGTRGSTHPGKCGEQPGLVGASECNALGSRVSASFLRQACLGAKGRGDLSGQYRFQCHCPHLCASCSCPDLSASQTPAHPRLTVFPLLCCAVLCLQAQQSVASAGGATTELSLASLVTGGSVEGAPVVTGSADRCGGWA